MNKENFKKFEIFLAGITNDVTKIFEHQKEYLCCKKGCSLCCERGDYPVSRVEFELLMKGFNTLDEESRREIRKKINIVKKENKESYICPFLKDKSCSVYEYRPICCRIFGVLTEDAAGNPVYPFCTEEKLNYYNIYDTEKGHLSIEKALKNGYKNLPHFFKLNNAIIMKLPGAKDIDFGETKKLSDFFFHETDANFDNERNINI